MSRMHDGIIVTRPQDVEDGLFGIYVARVVDDNDVDEFRFRVRVVVYGVNTGEEPVGDLPWAEVMFAGAAPAVGGQGDFKPYKMNDLVFVQFLAGSRYQPVVIGGCAATQAGVPSVPIEALADFDRAKKRWTRRDSVGNTIVMSEVPEETHVRIQSGANEIIVSGVGKGINIKAVRGAVKIEGATVEVASGQAVVRSNNVTIESNAEDVLQFPTGKTTVTANKTVDIGAYNPVEPVPALVRTEVNIGGRVDELLGVAVPPPTGRPPQQTMAVNVRSQEINLGVGAQTNPSTDTDGLPPIPLPPTLNINIRSTLGVSIKTPGSVAVHATMASVTAVDASITAVASCALKTLGVLSLEAAGPINILGTAALTIQAANLNFLSSPASPPIVLPPVP